MRVAVDVMGGDRAPDAIVTGALDAAALLGADDRVLLVGDESCIGKAIESSNLTPEQRSLYEVVPATQVIEMDDSPVEAIRNKPDSSIAVMNKLASKGQADAVISAGNTGACVAASQLRMRLLPGVSRPGIAVTIPTFHGPVVLCDVGANIAPRPKHLHDYAIMASAYSRVIAGTERPRVGLMSIGEEDGKGTAMVKQVRKILRDESLVNFVGNIEGRDLFKGAVDVVVCDGFVGNVVLKCSEGLAEGLFQTIMAELAEIDPELLGTLKPVVQQIYKKHDWQEYGGAPLLGVGKYSLICHGRSDSRAITNAIRVARQLVEANVNDRIVEDIAAGIQVAEETQEAEGAGGAAK